MLSSLYPPEKATFSKSSHIGCHHEHNLKGLVSQVL